jgi:hypothetical protein
MARHGRPTKYNAELPKQIRRLYFLGWTDPQVAEFLGVSERVFYRWIARYPEFRQAIKDGKAPADANVAVGLYQRATGYAHEASKFFVVDGAIVEQKYIERYPPDTAAAIIWLKNRQPGLWRDRLPERLDDQGRPAEAEGLKELAAAIRDSPRDPDEKPNGLPHPVIQ